MAGKGPYVDVLLQSIPTEGRVLAGCHAKELVVSEAGIGRVVSKKHDNQSLVLGQL